MNKQLEDKLDLMTRHLGTLQASVVESNRKLESLRVVLESQSKSSEKMADRLIQMAMVNQGMGREAAGHRRAQQQEEEPEVLSPSEDVLDELWADGCDVITMP